MIHASCRTTINMPADAIWQVISDFGAASRYLAGVTDCTVEARGSVRSARSLTPTAAASSSAWKRSTMHPSV